MTYLAVVLGTVLFSILSSSHAHLALTPVVPLSTKAGHVLELTSSTE